MEQAVREAPLGLDQRQVVLGPNFRVLLHTVLAAVAVRETRRAAVVLPEGRMAPVVVVLWQLLRVQQGQVAQARKVSLLSSTTRQLLSQSPHLPATAMRARGHRVPLLLLATDL
jgi:hypothetical protein